LSTPLRKLPIAPLALWLVCAPLQGSERGANAGAATASPPASPPAASPASPPGNGLVLTSEQLTAVGVVVGHAAAGKGSDRTVAFGEVIDPETLFADLGDAEEAQVADRASLRELDRMRTLIAAGDAAPKMLEAIEAERAKTLGRARATAARVASRWGPLARMNANERERILSSLGSGGGLLLRADVVGRQSIATPPHAALLDVDGVQVSGTVLGVLSQRAQPQSAALLIAVAAAPPGLGAGARVPVTLVTPPLTGRLLPHGAIFYDERGAFVFQRIEAEPASAAASGTSAKPAAATPTAFRTARIKLLGRVEDQSLVSGIDDDDEVVMRGGGALWSLLQIHGHAVDGDDDDDD